MSMYQKVKEFHKAMDLPVLDKPVVPDTEQVRLRLNLIAEEFFETVEATGINCFKVKDTLMDLIRYAKSFDVDLPEFADGCCDLHYVISGSALEFGYDEDELFDEVHAANMRKVGGPIRSDGKRLKPAGWVGPDIEGILISQGWKK